MRQYTGLEIAIIGMSVKFPGADDIKSFWNNLKNGVESIGFFTDEELRKEGEDQNVLHNPFYVKANGFIENKEYFDSSFFNYRPDEAKLMDPQMRIFHECLWKALEDAACNLNNSKNKIGVFAGASTDINWVVYSELVNRKGYVDNYTASQLNNARFLATRISYCLDLRGPSIIMDTACSSSLVAVQQACKSLLLAECNVAIAGGVSVNNESKKGYLYVEGMTHSRDGHCRTFDADASGTVGGEGAGVVILKTLKNALKDGDNIWAIIRGSGINNDGKDKVGFAAPSIDGQTEVIMMAQKWAKIEPESIGLIEAHGTATELGDPIEVEALNRAFGKSSEKYCALGSVKTNVGHLDAAAGVAGLIKAALSLKNRQLPPSLHFKTPNTKINFKDTPFYVNTKLKDWENEKYPLRAGVSSFGMGGTNVHIVLEEAPAREPSSESRDFQLLVVSAKTKTALERNIEELKNFLKENKDIKLSDIAYTLQIGRTPFQYRKHIVCRDQNEAIDLLSSINLKKKSPPLKETSQQKVVFMFSGQGSQYVNMCYDLYEKEDLFRKEVDNCFSIVKLNFNKDLKSILFTNNESEDSSKINNTEFSQPLLFIIEYSLARLLMNWGVNPDIMIGHSFGEYVAACISGLFSLEDALYLITKRGELMQKVSKGKMLGISISENDLNELIGKRKDISIATINSSELCVVSGSDESISAFKSLADNKGLSCKIIPNSNAYHSFIMDEILEEFGKVVKSVKINKPQIPFISNLTGKQVTDSEILTPDYWVNHLRQTVRFFDGINVLLQNDHVIFVEVGPGVELSVFVRSNKLRKEGHKVISLVRHNDAEGNDLNYLLSALGKLWINGVEPRWDDFYANESRRKISLPTYSFDKIKYPANVDAFKMISQMMSKDQILDNQDISKWFYLPSWKLSPLVFNSSTNNNSDCKLVFADDCGISDALIEKYKEKGEKIVCVRIGSFFQEKSSVLYEINPAQEEGYKELFLRLSKYALLPDCIIHGWGVTKQEASDFSEQSCQIFFYSLLEIAKSFHTQEGISRRQIVLLTNDLHHIAGKEKIASVKSLAVGLLKVISQEYQIITSHIDISLSEEIKSTLIDDLNKEIQAKETGKTISFRQARRWELIYDRIQTISDTSFQPFKVGGVYLITGGLGSFGFLISKFLLETQQAKVILLGRTKIPLRDQWDKCLESSTASESVKDKIQKLRLLEKEPGEILYLDCNIEDKEKMINSVLIAERKFGPVCGIFHAAGIVTGRSLNPISELEKKDFEIQFAPKIKGLQVLKEVMGNKELDFCLLTSSLSPILGGIGFGAYGPANIFMDYYINSYRGEGELKNWISVNIDGFNFDQKIDHALDKIEILEVLCYALAFKELPQVIVSKADLHKRLEKWVYKKEIIPEEGQEPELMNTKPDDMLYESGDDSLNPLEKKLLTLWKNFFGKLEIALDDDFFEMGGDSLKAITFIKRINKAFNLNLTIVEFFKRPTIEKMSEYISTIKNGPKKEERYISIPKAKIKENYPLSSAQERLYFLYEFDITSLAYILPKFIRVKGDLDKERLNNAFYKLIARHESLRTSFEMTKTGPVQKISENVKFEIQYFNSSEEEVKSIIKNFIKPFHLNVAPLISIGLIQTAPQEYILVLVIHHIITDGVSGGVLINDFMSLYNDEELPELHLQYKDYSVWQQSDDHQKELENQRKYWLQEFSEIPENLTIPMDFKRPLIKSFDGDLLAFEINQKEIDALNLIAKEQEVSLYMVFLTILNIFLSKLRNHEDIIVGTVSSGRLHADLEGIIGMFVNTLVLRNQMKSNYAFTEILQEVKVKVLLALDNQGYQYEDLLSDLKLERDTGRNPLFDVMFSYDSFEKTELKIPGLSLEPYNYDEVFAKFDLTLTVHEKDKAIYLNFEYNTSLFKQETIQRFIVYFKKIVSTIATNADIKLSEIDILTDQEKYTILNEFNNTTTDFSKEKTITDLFEEQVKCSSLKTALISRNLSLSYQWLNAASNQVANLLRDKGVKKESSVVVIMERHADMIIVLLGILKSGAKYIPIEPYVPDNRIIRIAISVNAEIIITNKENNIRINQVGNEISSVRNILSIDIDSSPSLEVNEIINGDLKNLSLSNYSNLNLENWNSSEDLAYVIFTSGSTGDPKGVAVQHKPVINLIEWVNKTYNIGEKDKVLFVSSISFDLSVYDIFGILASGGTVRLANKEELEDPDILANIIVEEGITFWDSAPAMLQQVIPFLENRKEQASIADLKLCFLSGDWIPLAMPTQMKSLFSKLRFIALGGATEATVWSNFYEVEKVDDNWTSIPYGKPIQNAKYLILNSHRKLCPVGVPGDLYIGGQCLAMGYINDKELSDRKFVRNTFENDGMLYDTGDMAKWFPDGNIEFLGRKDSQIKIRGYRIELGEIESRLIKFNGIDQVLAHVIGNNRLDKNICIYYTSKNELPEQSLKDFLRADLPVYMVPKYFVHLKEIPMTKNGKVDRKLLPSPKLFSDLKQIKKPQTDTEKELVQIWADILHLDEDKIGVQEDFFELGGHSIMAVHLINIIQQKFYVNIKLRKVFEYPSIEKLSGLIDRAAVENVDRITKTEKKDYYPASPAQQRLFYEQLLNKDNLAYNIRSAYEIKGEIDVAKLTQSLQSLIDRHACLRTSFLLSDNGVIQKINEKVNIGLIVLDQKKFKTPEDAFVNFIKPFDLGIESLARFGLLTDTKKRNFFFVDVHHIICDGISLNILMNDFKKIYQGHELMPLDLQYIDYVSWLNDPKKNLEKQKEFWLNKLSGELPRLDLPVIQDRESVNIYPASMKALVLNNEIYKSIKKYSADSNVSDFMFLLSIFYILLSKISGNMDIIIGTDVIGRTQKEFNGIVGTFINLLPLRINIPPQTNYKEFLQTVKECVLESFDNQDFQFDQMISSLKKEKRLSGNLFDVHFAFSNYLDSDIEINELDFIPIEVKENLTTQYEFKLEVAEENKGLKIAFVYSSELYEDATIEVLKEYYFNILADILNNDLVDVESIELKKDIATAQYI